MSIATRLALGEELLKLAADHDFVACNADTKACGLEKMERLYPDRAFSFGIAEQNLLGVASGLAACGNKVIVSTFAVFLSMRACEQVRTFICYPNLNVTLLGTHTGLQVGGDGATHAAIEDVSILRSFPNMTIIQPADEISARAMAPFVAEFEGPLYVRLHRNAVDDVYNSSYRFEFGKMTRVCDYGRDLTIISSGILLKKALEAAEALKDRGVFARVLDASTIKPLDEASVLRAAEETGAILTVEDHTVFGGLGSAVAECVVKHRPVPMELVGIPDRFGESGDPELLYRDNGMDTASIIEKAIALVGRKG